MLQQDETDSGLQTFLQKMSLRTGAEVITFLQVINKASGVYGLLALLTGAKIDGWQLSMYLYSTFALVATTFLYKHIRLQSPFESVLLAHLYALDSVINALYTAFFGIAWFYALAAHPDDHEEVLVDGDEPDRAEVTGVATELSGEGLEVVQQLLVDLLDRSGERGILYRKFRDFTGKYVMHCHNVVHEDHAMMVRFDVE